MWPIQAISPKILSVGEKASAQCLLEVEKEMLLKSENLATLLKAENNVARR